MPRFERFGAPLKILGQWGGKPRRACLPPSTTLKGHPSIPTYIVVGVEDAGYVLRQVSIQHGLDVVSDVDWGGAEGWGGCGTLPFAPPPSAPRQHPLTVPQVEVVGCPSRPQAHGVDGVVHVPGHGRIVGQCQHHLDHREDSQSWAGLCPALVSPHILPASPERSHPTDPPAGASSGFHPPSQGCMCGNMLGTPCPGNTPAPPAPPAPPVLPGGWCLLNTLRGWRQACGSQEKLHFSHRAKLCRAYRPAGCFWVISEAAADAKQRSLSPSPCPPPLQFAPLLPFLLQYNPLQAGMLAGPMSRVQPATKSPPR